MIIKNAIVCDADGERQVDIEIIDGLITKIDKNLDGSDSIDAKGSYLLPGLVDLNVSLKDSQLNVKRLQALSASALKGGVTTVVLNPETQPAINNEIVLEFVLERKFEGAKISSAICATKEDTALSNIAILLKNGAVAPSLDSSVDSNLIRRVFEYMKMYDGTVFCKANDRALNGNGVMFEGKVSASLGLPGISVLGEIIHVTKMIEVARYFNVQVLFKGLFTRRSLEMIKAAKEEGLKVFSEISIHHLLLDDTSCADFNTKAKIFPPLSDAKGKNALIESLKNGEIDILTSLHSPQSKVNKEVAFFDAAYGTEAIENILPLYYSRLVKTGLITMSELSKMVSFRPSQMINKNIGLIKVGMIADLVIFDINQETKIENEKNLYNGEVLSGKISSIFVNAEEK